MLNTKVTTETMDLSDMFPAVTPEKETTLFQKPSDAINIDAADDEDETEPAAVAAVVAPVVDKTVTPIVVAPAKNTIVPGTTPSLEDLDNSTEDFEAAKAGSKTGLVEFFKEKIVAGELTAFDDYDETKQTIDEYLATFKPKDFDELWKSNVTQKEAELASKMPQEFYDSLPGELQYAAKYVADGGTDLKGLFHALAQVEEVKQLDPVKDARKVCENYLSAKQFGTPEEIKEQLDEWEDLNTLTKKSQGFKPQLDKMEELMVQQKLDKQTEIKKNQVAQSEYYHDSVIEALKTENLHGIKLDKKTQISLYKGLTEGSFVDSRGKRCTEFEHLLDKAMWSDTPDYKTLATIQWILKDREGYEKALGNRAVNANTEEIVRTLKTEQAKNKTAVVESAAPAPKRIVRQGGGLFKRS